MLFHILIRRLAIFCLLMSMAGSVFAQPETPQSPYVNIKVNYVRSWLPKAPESNANSLMTKLPKDMQQITSYLDGQGRPLQTVVKMGSLETGGSATDLVNPVVYDAFGMEKLTYLPFPSTATDGTQNNGLLKNNPFQQQIQFYNTHLAGQTGEINVGPNQLNWAYSQTSYEASPLNRVEKKLEPGTNWIGANRGYEFKFWTNTITDDVKKWNVSDVANSFGSYTVDNSYLPGELYKKVFVDEHQKQVIEFKDKNGNVVLKKVQLTAVADNSGGSDYAGWLCTYYIYDDLGNLRCVVQPKGVELLIDNGWDITALDNVILNEQCFRYEYDGRNRMNRKKIPGSGEVLMVYDVKDRMVFAQDANLRDNQQWTVILYDGYNRPVVSGMITYSGTFTALQELVTTQTAQPSNPNPGIAVDLVLNTVTPTGTYQAMNSITMNPGFESAPAAEIVAEINPGPGGLDGETTYIEGVAINKNPIPPGVDFTLLSITYYDNYNWAADLSSQLKDFNITYANSFLLGSPNSYPYPQPVQYSTATKGLATGAKVRVLNSNQFIKTVNFYDDKSRLIHVRSENIADGIDVVTSQYNWIGQPLVTVVQQNKGETNPQTFTMVTKMDYDDLGRVLAIKKTMNGTVDGQSVSKPELELLKFEYDKLGQVKTKSIGKRKDGSGAYTAAPMETQTLRYNIRGWLLGVNNNEVLGSNGSSDRYFGYELGYDKTGNFSGRNFTGTQYNGNISGVVWKSFGDGVRRKYDFTYDAANRLMQGLFEQHNDDNSWNNNEINFNVKVGDGSDVGSAYDANGNIIQLQHWGVKGLTSSQVDNLNYRYMHSDNSNKLLNVIDNNNDPQTKLGDFRTSTLHPESTTKNALTVDYRYDDNGNMVKDLNKDIVTSEGADGILYNHLNLPWQVTIKKDATSNKGTITYVYDAVGKKLKKITTDISIPGKTITHTTLYLNGFVYESRQTSPADPGDFADKLIFAAHEEGRLRFTPANGSTAAKFDYDYFLKDQSGNVRMVLTDEQKQTIYPAATLEGNISDPAHAVFVEKDYYNINENFIVNKPGGVGDYANKNGGPNAQDAPVNNNPNSNVTAISQKMYQLHSNTNKTGLGITLKVMAGDIINIYGRSYYSVTGSIPGSPSAIPILDLLTAFAGTPAMSGKGISGTDLNGKGALVNGIAELLEEQPEPTTTKPKAFINWIIFDEQFNYAGGGFDGVGDDGSVKIHDNTTIQGISIPRNGYIYVYCSNESQQNVYFDNLQVIHTFGPLVEETHYYPYGLTMAGISSKAQKPGYNQNKQKFSGKELQSNEFSDGSGLEMYDFGVRNYDPQIGRWHTIDPLSDKMRRHSPYNYAFDNPLRYIDPDGMSPFDWVEYTDATGNKHAVWVEGVTQESHLKWWVPTARGNGTKIIKARYIGKTGIIERGTVEGDPEIKPYELLEGGNYNVLEYGKPTKTKHDRGNAEPESGEGEPGGEDGGQEGGKEGGKGNNLASKLLDALNNAEDGYSLGKAGAEGMVAGAQMLSNKAVGKSAMDGLVTNVMEQSPIGRALKKVAPAVDVLMDIREGSYVKAGIKIAWALAEKPLMAAGPVGLGIVLAGNIVMGVLDIFKLW